MAPWFFRFFIYYISKTCIFNCSTRIFILHKFALFILLKCWEWNEVNVEKKSSFFLIWPTFFEKKIEHLNFFFLMFLKTMKDNQNRFFFAYCLYAQMVSIAATLGNRLFFFPLDCSECVCVSVTFWFFFWISKCDALWRTYRQKHNHPIVW